MNTKKYWMLVFSICCCVLFLAPNAFCISHDEKRQIEMFGISTLSGLRGVKPIVIFEVPANLGLSKEAFQAQVELELRKAEVKIISDTDPNVNADDVGKLMVMFRVVKALGIYPKTTYFVSLSVVLYQDVGLIRNPKIRTRVATWPLVHNPQLGIVLRKDVEQRIQNTLTKMMNIFINDYLAANPKEPVRKPRLVPDDLPDKINQPLKN